MTVTRRRFIQCALAMGGSLLLPLRTESSQPSKTEPWSPAYERLEKAGGLAERVEQAFAQFSECRLCPRQCGVNRLKGEAGFCRAPDRAMMYSAHPHFGEEDALAGRHGSGTIFFSNCNLRCVFCQNWPIAPEGLGVEISDEDLAAVMLKLQAIGCHNINLVTPTHVMPNILNATRLACQQGLRIPLFYNTSGYERVEILKPLDGIVDLYKRDLKFMHPDKAELYLAGAADYPEVTQKAILEMHRQVGLLEIDKDGLARRGLMIRHLVMPNRVAGTREFVAWVAAHLRKATYVNIMHQYHVDYKAFKYPDIWRSITAEEYLEAMAWAEAAGPTHLDPRSIKVRNFYRANSNSSQRMN